MPCRAWRRPHGLLLLLAAIAIATVLWWGQRGDFAEAAQLVVSGSSWQTALALDVLVLVNSKASNGGRRDALRQSYAEHLRAGVVFAVTAAHDQPDSELRDEALQRRDVLLVSGAHLGDVYEHQTPKMMAVLAALGRLCQRRRCPRFALKLDDDVFVNPAPFAALTAQLGAAARPAFFCNVTRGAAPVRRPSSKYFVSRQQFAGGAYPAYCQGPAYFFSLAAVQPLLLADSARLRAGVARLPLEDVYISGILAADIGAVHRAFPQHTLPSLRRDFWNFSACLLARSTFLHSVPDDRLFALLLDRLRRPNC